MKQEKSALRKLLFLLKKLQQLKNTMRKDTKNFLKMSRREKYLKKSKRLSGNVPTAVLDMKAKAQLKPAPFVHIRNHSSLWLNKNITKEKGARRPFLFYKTKNKIFICEQMLKHN